MPKGPKVGYKLLAEMLLRALVLGTDREANSKCTHAPICIWEDFYNLDDEVIRLSQKRKHGKR